METSIKVSARNVYGSILLYPASPQANRLADLMGTKTLTLSTLSKAQGMGFVIEVAGHFRDAQHALAHLAATR